MCKEGNRAGSSPSVLHFTKQTKKNSSYMQSDFFRGLEEKDVAAGLLIT